MDKPFYKKSIFFLAILFVVNLILFYIPGLPGSIPTVIKNDSVFIIPDLRINYSHSEINSFLEKIGPEGRIAYQKMHLTIDLAFPMVYGLFFFFLLQGLFKKLHLANSEWAAIGFIPSIFDLGENFSLIYITERFPDFPQKLADAVHWLTIAKFSSMVIIIGLICFLGVKLLLPALKNP